MTVEETCTQVLGGVSCTQDTEVLTSPFPCLALMHFFHLAVPVVYFFKHKPIVLVNLIITMIGLEMPRGLVKQSSGCVSDRVSTGN